MSEEELKEINSRLFSRARKEDAAWKKGMAERKRSEAELLASLSCISGRVSYPIPQALVEMELENSKPRLKIWGGARRIQVCIPDDTAGMLARHRAWQRSVGQIDEDSGKRGECRGFSAASRRRLFEKMSTISRAAAVPVFYTLTIPREWYSGPQAAKDAHRAFLKRLFRAYDETAVLWKIEPQEDGTAHFHGLAWMQFLPWQWCAVAWVGAMSGQVLPDDYPVIRGKVGAWAFRKWVEKLDVCDVTKKALNAAVRVEQIKTWRGTMSYVSKYIGKVVECEGWGRIWGIAGKKCFPAAECEVEIVEFDTAYLAISAIRRKLRAWRGWEPWIERARTLIDDRPDKFWRILKKKEGR